MTIKSKSTIFKPSMGLSLGTIIAWVIFVSIIMTFVIFAIVNTANKLSKKESFRVKPRAYHSCGSQDCWKKSIDLSSGQKNPFIWPDSGSSTIAVDDISPHKFEPDHEILVN